MAKIHKIESSDEPMDRLTELAGELTAFIHAHPTKYEGVRAVVVLSDTIPGTDQHRGGMSVVGYEDMGDAALDMLANTQALFETLGIDMAVLSPTVRNQG